MCWHTEIVRSYIGSFDCEYRFLTALVVLAGASTPRQRVMKRNEIIMIAVHINSTWYIVANFTLQQRAANDWSCRIIRGVAGNSFIVKPLPAVFLEFDTGVFNKSWMYQGL